MTMNRSHATVLEYDVARELWTSRYVDLLAQNVTLPDVCYIFLEAGDWYANCRESDRRKILEPFHAPDLISSKTCTDLNGYFGSQSSFAPNGTNADALASLNTWFRILTKKVLKPEEGVSDKGKDYLWYEMGFFTYWKGPSVCRILCIGTPPEMSSRLKVLLAGPRPLSLELRDPLALLWPLIDEIIKLFDDHVWRVTKLVRAIEMNRWRRPDFESHRNLSRHTGHLVEVEQVAIETIQRILAQQENNFGELAEVLNKTYREQKRQYLEFQVQVMRSLRARTQSTHARLSEEIDLAYNMLASSDNEIMKSITLLTMIFLPATFISALFSTTFFSFSEDGWQFSSSFWIYWVVVIPLTILVLIIWWWWLGGSYEVIRSQWLHSRKTGLKG